MARIICTFDRFGNSRVEVEGVSGSSCIEKTQSVEQALAGAEVKRDLKSDYYDDAAQSTGVHQEQGW